MEATAVDMVATTARGLLMPSLRLRPRLSLDTVTATAVDMAMAVMAVDMVATTARGLLMPSLRLMLLLRLSPVMVIVAAMAATDTAGATDTTARGRLRLSPATATVDTAMVVTVVAMAATDTAGATDTTARGR